VTDSLTIDPSTVCTECNKPWHEHWGFNCDEPYANRKFRPLLPGLYPPNRGDRNIPRTIWRKTPPTVSDVKACQWWWNRSDATAPYVLHLDVEDGRIVHADDDGDSFDAELWGNEWCPCVPPITEEATEFSP